MAINEPVKGRTPPRERSRSSSPRSGDQNSKMRSSLQQAVDNDFNVTYVFLSGLDPKFTEANIINSIASLIRVFVRITKFHVNSMTVGDHQI